MNSRFISGAAFAALYLCGCNDPIPKLEVTREQRKKEQAYQVGWSWVREEVVVSDVIKITSKEEAPLVIQQVTVNNAYIPTYICDISIHDINYPKVERIFSIVKGRQGFKSGFEEESAYYILDLFSFDDETLRELEQRRASSFKNVDLYCRAVVKADTLTLGSVYSVPLKNLVDTSLSKRLKGVPVLVTVKTNRGTFTTNLGDEKNSPRSK